MPCWRSGVVLQFDSYVHSQRKQPLSLSTLLRPIWSTDDPVTRWVISDFGNSMGLPPCVGSLLRGRLWSRLACSSGATEAGSLAYKSTRQYLGVYVSSREFH